MIDFSNLAVMVPFVPPARAANHPRNARGGEWRRREMSWGSGAEREMSRGTFGTIKSGCRAET